MSHVEKRTCWTRTGSRWAGALAIAALITCTACASSTPAPHVVEVPIDQYQPPPGPAPQAPVEPPPVQAAEPPAEPEPVEPNTGGHPVQLHGNPESSDHVTSAECLKAFDRYAILKGVAGGMTMAAASRQLTSLRSQTRLDPTMQGFTKTCMEKFTKDQTHCAIKASQVGAWKTCVQ